MGKPSTEGFNAAEGISFGVWTELSLPEYYVNKYKQQGSVARAKAGELAHPRDHRLLAASDARHRATEYLLGEQY